MTDKQYGAPALASPGSEAPKRNRGVQRALWIAGPLVVLFVALWLVLTSGRYESTENAYVGGDQVTIAPQVAGRVVQVEVQSSQPVHVGDVLFRLDDAKQRLAVRKLKAQMAAVGNYLAGTRDSLHGARARLQAATRNLELDIAQLDRLQGLRQQGLVAQKAVDDATQDVADARSERDSAHASVAQTSDMLGGKPKAALDTQAAYQMIDAQLEAAQLELERTVVRAPVDGVLGPVQLEAGDFLQVGEATLPLIASGRWVDANFKETSLTHVQVGDPATIEVDTYPDHVWHAEVASISPASGGTFALLPAQNASGNWVKVVQRIPVRLRIETEPGDPVLRVGMSASVEIDTGADNSIWGSWFGDTPGGNGVAARP